MGVLRWWLDQGAELLPDQVDGILRRLVMSGLGRSPCPPVAGYGAPRR